MTTAGRMDPDDARDQLEQTTRNLNAATAKARTIVNAVNRGNRQQAADGTQSFIEFWHDLDDDQREHLALNALTMLIQVQDQWNTLKAQYGNRKIK